MKNYTKRIYNTTTNNSFYRKVYKRYISKKFGKCSRCGWHSGENRNGRYPRYLKSWKKNSKRKHQYNYINLC